MRHLERPHVLSKPIDHKELYVYLDVSQHAVSASLVRNEDRIQKIVYYGSKRLTGADRNYPKIEKLAY